MNNETGRLLGFLGLCRRAGKLVLGTPLICEALRGRTRPCLVLLSEGASPTTQKKLKNKTEFYGVPLHDLAADPETLAHAVGKTGALAAVAVTDAGMAKAILARLAPSKETEGHPISTGKEPPARGGKDA